MTAIAPIKPPPWRASAAANYRAAAPTRRPRIVIYRVAPPYAAQIASGVMTQLIRPTAEAFAAKARVGDRVDLRRLDGDGDGTPIFGAPPQVTLSVVACVARAFVTLEDDRIIEHPEQLERFAQASGFASYARLIAHLGSDAGEPQLTRVVSWDERRRSGAP